MVTERHVQSVTEVSASPSPAAQLGVVTGSSWLRTEMLRVDPAKPDTPICWTDVYLEPTLGAGIRRELRKSTGLICEMVEQRFGRVVKEVRQEIRAIGVPARIAKQLVTEPDGHALEITRHYVDENGIVFEATVSVFPADRFTYSSALLKESPTKLVSSLIESKFGKRVAEVEQTIRAISLSAELAECLNAEQGTPG